MLSHESCKYGNILPCNVYSRRLHCTYVELPSLSGAPAANVRHNDDMNMMGCVYLNPPVPQIRIKMPVGQHYSSM